MQLVTWLEVKLLTKLWKFHKICKKNSETVTNVHDKEILIEGYISPEKRQETLMISDLNNSIIMEYLKITK